MGKTFSPDPQHLGDGAGFQADQSIVPRQNADHENGGWVTAPTGVAANMAYAGTPGHFDPSGSTVPANLAAMTPGVFASPASAWTTGQHVVLGDASHAFWNGTAWAAGNAAVAAAGAPQKATTAPPPKTQAPKEAPTS